ncbi:MAG: hypothetical protein QGH76_04320 [Phycisphaerales bacterium]|jgi:hypothetical protein|nr:hypothetical protein [Phycisphaerales bacterium]
MIVGKRATKNGDTFWVAAMCHYRSTMQSIIMTGVFAGVLAASAAAQAETWHVPGDCPSIQAAIDAASNGDEVVVELGRWREQIDFLGKAILVRSTHGAEETVIDGGQFRGSVVTFRNGESRDTELRGFTVKGGRADLGGGIRIMQASPTIRLCLIEFNTAGKGGGIFVDRGEPSIESCVFSFNIADDGDGVWCSHCDPAMTTCIFAGDGIGWDDGQIVTIRRACGPSGACCVDGACIEATAVACWDAGGLYRGDDVPCGGVCDPGCDEDVTGDGVVNLTDLLRVIGAFGFCG